jgi:hypothetical protein
MTPVPPTPTPRRHVWRWVLLGAGICLTPFVVIAVAAVSFLTLERNASVLRNQVMDATDAGWSTKVQVSVGGLTLGALRQGLRFVHNKDMAEARLALGSVRHASVGVYERTSAGTSWSREQLFNDTDRVMQKRGWVRLVGVADQKDTVLIYVPQDMKDDEPIDLCLATVSGKEMVVVSTSIDATKLAELVELHSGGDIKNHLHFAKFQF